ADISFNLGKDVTAVNGKNITITAGGGEVITIAANDATQVSIMSGVVTINPNLELLNGTNYTVAIEAGAFIDGAGNEFDGTLAADGTFDFTIVAANNNGGVDNDGNTTIMPISTTNTDTNGNVMEVIDLTEFAGKTVTGSFEINREAKYNNNVYFYKVDNNNGDIGSLTPDASGYLQTALNNVINPSIDNH
ncbi:MAG: Ig-like domain-containing protein, partial [Rivularia sp. (in: cyanobacteria)]